MDTMINGMTENGKQPGIRIESNGKSSVLFIQIFIFKISLCKFEWNSSSKIFFILILCFSGVVSNIPPGMLTDQYGIAGMLAFLRTIENEPSILGMALGYDLTHLGLNLNSSE